VSTARVMPWRAVNVVTAGVLFAVGFAEIGRTPALLDLAVAAALLVAGIAILYSLWMVAASVAFWVVKIDNLTFLFSSIFDAARWPSSVFRGLLRVLFTFVIPLAVMTTFPAQALLGRAGAVEIVGGLGTALLALVVSRRLWVRAVGRYTSASS
jgi:ABC-2 type transport system permease protein